MQKRPYPLLQSTWSKRRNTIAGGGLLGGRQQRRGVPSGANGGGGGGLMLRKVLLDEISVVFLDGAAQQLEHESEQEDADTGAGKDGVGGDAPLGGEEAGVCCVEVEEHLGEAREWAVSSTIAKSAEDALDPDSSCAVHHCTLRLLLVCHAIL